MAELKNPVLCITAGKNSSSLNQPAAFASVTPVKSLVKSPKLFATVNKSKTVIGSPRVFVSVTEGSPVFSLSCDTRNAVIKDFAINGDVLLANVENAVLMADSCRKLTAAYDIYADSSITFTRPGEAVPFNMQADSKCRVLKSYKIYADSTVRSRREAEPVDFDMQFDSLLIIRQGFSIKGDGISNVQRPFSLFFDSCLKMPYDTTFIPANTDEPSSPFIIPPQKAEYGMVSMKISLNELTLSDSFEMETTYPVNVLDAISGMIFDYRYSYVIGETDQQDMTITASGMYDVDRILYMPMKYSEGSIKHKAGYHAKKIAGALGKKLNIAIDDFTHSSTWVGNGQTYESIISSLFGWTSEIPHRQINVFLRAADNSINIIQRGHEAKTTDISSTHHTRPQFHRELVRTMWSGKSSNGTIASVQNINIEPIPFSGTITFGDSSCSYISGYLVQETANGDSSEYSYEGSSETGMYLSSKNIRHSDGSRTVITYNYNMGAGGVRILGEEKEITYDKKDRIQSRRLTVHAPLGNGFYGTSVYVDGEYQGSSISTGSPSGVASRYMRNEESITLGGARYSGSSDRNDGNSFIDEANFPVEESDILKRLTKELKWLNRRIKETVSMDIYNYGHALDFFEKIRFNGHDYFLVSNEISQTTRELKQSITIVRWY